jgi:hypothetical protein
MGGVAVQTGEERDRREDCCVGRSVYSTHVPRTTQQRLEDRASVEGGWALYSGGHVCMRW